MEYTGTQQLSQLQNIHPNAIDAQSLLALAIQNQEVESNLVRRQTQRPSWSKKSANCVKCSKPAPVGFRYKVKDSPGNFYCKTCYNAQNTKMKRDTCTSCHVTKDSLTWFKSKKTPGGATLCQKCYTSEMNARALRAVTVKAIKRRTRGFARRQIRGSTCVSTAIAKRKERKRYRNVESVIAMSRLVGVGNPSCRK